MTRALLTCSSQFVESALNELHRYHPDLSVLQHISPGYTLLEIPQSFGKLTAPWKNRLPIYLHHLFPVHAIVPLNGTRDDLEALKRCSELVSPSDSLVQARMVGESTLPYSAEDIQHCLNHGQPRNCLDTPSGRVLSILVSQGQTGFEAYAGISWAAQNLSPWAGGQIPIREPVSNRAGYKLLEALHAFAIRLRHDDHALDLGAAPGAWTTLLRKRGLRVTAVAPTPLYPWLTCDPDVVYERILAEEFLIRCETTFDLIVNDMKLDGQPSARLMVDYARHLRPEGIAIMTLKLREHNKQRVMDHSFRILRKAYKIIAVRQLVSNRSEVTLFLRRKG